MYQRCNIHKCKYFTFIKTCNVVVCTHALYLKYGCGCYGFNSASKNVNLPLDSGNSLIIYTCVNMVLLLIGLHNC